MEGYVSPLTMRTLPCGFHSFLPALQSPRLACSFPPPGPAIAVRACFFFLATVDDSLQHVLPASACYPQSYILRFFCASRRRTLARDPSLKIAERRDCTPIFLCFFFNHLGLYLISGLGTNRGVSLSSFLVQRHIRIQTSFSSHASTGDSGTRCLTFPFRGLLRDLL